MTARPGRPTRILTGLAVLAALTGCSGGGGGNDASPSATGPTGPCDKARFVAHAGLASGAITTYVWQPFEKGAFKDGAKDRAKALSAAQRASVLAANELAAGKTLVVGCPEGTRLQNALTTGASLTTAAGKQFAAGKPNTETLAGANSIITTIVAEAKLVGIDVGAMQPTEEQLAAGKAS